MTSDRAHITVCICTYKRPGRLARLLEALRDQETEGLFTYAIVVVDNDRAESGRAAASAFAAAAAVPLKYCVEPRQSIPLARNKAIENAAGDFVALIDDDECPTRRWLLTLFKALDEHPADGVLGPVMPRFEGQPPQWVIEGRFYERPVHQTGARLESLQCRTGNALLRTNVFTALDAPPFRPEFPRGEDRDFFRRSIESGHVFIGCAEAGVFEDIPPARWERTFLLRRALARGHTSLRHSISPARDIATSVVAVPSYAAALPFALVLGHHRFMACLVRLCDHLGRLFAVVGISPVKQPYATD